MTIALISWFLLVKYRLFNEVVRVQLCEKRLIVDALKFTYYKTVVIYLNVNVTDVFHSLEEINLSHNNLTSVCIELYNIPSLVKLNLAYNKLELLSRSKHHDLDQHRRSTNTGSSRCKQKCWLNRILLRFRNPKIGQIMLAHHI